MILRTSILLLSLLGLANALYFTFAYYGRVKKSRWVPEVLCAREGSSCVTVLQTPFARLFRVPNSLLGGLFCLLVVAWALRDWSKPLEVVSFGRYVVLRDPVCVLTLAGGGAVLLGFYLVYVLWRKLRVHCPLCYASHAINLVLFILMVLSQLGR